MRYLMLSIAFLALAACGNSSSSEGAKLEAAEPQVVKETAITPAPKTGAAVVFASDFAGPLQVGERAALVIQLQPQYASGLLEVVISGAQGLIIIGETEFRKAFEGAEQFTHELMVGADQAGEYYLSIIVTVTTEFGPKEARAFSETISVADLNLTPSMEKVMEDENGIEDERLGESYLPAREQIITH